MAKVLELCAVDFTAYHLLRPLGIGLRDAGFEVVFCCSPGEGLDLLAEEGFQTRAIPISRDYNVARHARSFAALLALARRERFAIVHAHTPVAGLIGRAAARLARVPVVAYTAHGFYFHEGMRPAVHAFFVELERRAAALSDVIFVQSREDWEEALRLRIAPPRLLVHIGNGVDPERFGRAAHEASAALFREEHGIESAPVVGFVGRIVREKGAVDFVRAASVVKREAPNAKFVMVGAPLGSDRDSCLDEIMRLRDELGLGADLILTGYRRDVPALLASFDLFTLPSHREGMPRALLEAMALSLPVFGTAVGGVPEVVENGVTGRLTERRDPEAFADGILGLLADPGLLRRCGEAGRERYERRFRVGPMVRAYDAIYRRCLAARTGS